MPHLSSLTCIPRTCRRGSAFLWLLHLCAPLLLCAASGQDRFTRIGQGSIVNDSGISAGFSWGDYDGDGFVDLFVPNWNNQNNFLYHNNADGTFSAILEGPVVNDRGYSSGGCWGDYDNDGDLDLFVANQANQNNCLYNNQGDGTLIKVLTGDIVNDYGNSYAAAWGDYDNDGLIDLFVANVNQPSFLYRNIGDGRFTRIRRSALVEDTVIAWNASWGDFDGDGALDLFIANSSPGDNLLFRNRGDGTFEKITDDPVVKSSGYSKGGSWGDYDNDGDLDLFVANAGTSLEGSDDCLYTNNGDGTFTQVTEGDPVNSAGYSHGGDWGDYDNDGDLDLFVGIWGLCDRLYWNNGDGTFTEETASAIVKQPGFVAGNVPGADYDNDGDLDIFLPNWENQNNILFRNNSGGLNWIRVRCQGVASNSFGIGARVTVRARISGRTVTQSREIKTNSGCRGQGDMDASFGLGDASIVEWLVIRWPSGRVEELSAIEANQIVVIREGQGVVNRMRPERARSKPPIYQILLQALAEDGLNAAITRYRDSRANHSEEYDFSETQLNYLGYRLLQEGKHSEAIEIFKLNIEAFPQSANAHDSLAEALLIAGDTGEARSQFTRVLEILADDVQIEEQTREVLLNKAKYTLKNLE